MITVYVIESISDGTRYTGMAIDPDKRLKEHNNGKNRFTKGHLPWKLVYKEMHLNWQEARKREKYLKSAAGKKWLSKGKGGDTSSLPA
jgi:predicted GIY-YIG superfamily endonuclease